MRAFGCQAGANLDDVTLDGRDLQPVLDVADLLRALVNDLVTGDVPDCVLGRLVELAAHAVPSADCADLVVAGGGELRQVAASAGCPPELDAVRTASGEGPGYAALTATAPVLCDDLADEPRWPGFGQQITQRTGLRSQVSYQVRLHSGGVGALSCYSAWPFGFDPLAVVTGQLIAAGCALADYARRR